MVLKRRAFQAKAVTPGTAGTSGDKVGLGFRLFERPLPHA